MDEVYLEQAERNSRAEIEAGINKARNNIVSLIPTGSCYYCLSSVAQRLVFCDADCHGDWEYEQEVRRKQSR